MEDKRIVDNRENVREVRDPNVPGQAAYVRESAQTVRDPYLERQEFLSRATQLVYLIFGVIEIMIALRVILKALAANTGSAFVNFVYGFTNPLVAPFSGIVSTPNVSGFVFELSSLIALLVYALLSYIIVRLLWVVLDRRPADTNVVRNSERQIRR